MLRRDLVTTLPHETPLTGPLPRRAPKPLTALASLTLLALLATALPTGAAQAGQIRETDLMVSSKVGKVSTSATGDKTEARTGVHTIDIRRGSHTGDVNVSGKADRVTTQAGGQNTSADSAIGGVTVGGNK